MEINYSRRQNDSPLAVPGKTGNGRPRMPGSQSISEASTDNLVHTEPVYSILEPSA